MLDFARPIRFDLAEADVNQVCQASAEAAWAGDALDGVTLDFEQTLPPVITDAERLRTALVNILTNARHAVLAVRRADTGTHGPIQGAADQPRVVVRTRLVNGGVSIVVHDDGVGIGPDDIAHIFDPYFTTRRAGTGLGLPIAKNIIDGLGGTLTVSSRRGAGTDVRIDLPSAVAGAMA